MKLFFYFNIPLPNDLMTVEKYLPANTKLSFTIRKSSNYFLIWKDDTDKDTDKDDITIKILIKMI